MIRGRVSKKMRRGALAGVAAALLAGTAVLAATSYPNDSFFVAGYQWALTGATASINAPQAWCVSTGAGITVADIDTGADFNHPDLAGRLIAGAKFTSGRGDSSRPDATGQAAVQDDNGHGTMTTGIIAANTGNSTGIAAVAPDAKALIIKVLGSDGTGYSTDVAAAIRWAVDNGARVINLSLGTDSPLKGNVGDLTPAVTQAAQRNVAIAVASGNDPSSQNFYQLVQNVGLVVGALAPNGSVAPYSNSSNVNIYAPGGDHTQGGDPNHLIVSTWWNNGSTYGMGEGTSFAAPQAAGVLALLMSTGYSAADARNKILSTAIKRNGVPELAAAAALGAGGPCGTPPPSPTGSPSPLLVATYKAAASKSITPVPTTTHSNPGSVKPSPANPPDGSPAPAGQSPPAQAAPQSPAPDYSIIAIPPDAQPPGSKTSKRAPLPITLAAVVALLVSIALLRAQLREPYS
jgi:subtilisin family serine protease